jgi:dihydrofolate reductase
VRVRLPSISYVVARSWPDSIIGRNNELPWHLRTDLQRFKTITLSHPIIMGRKTHLSIGGPLPGRVNIVLSRASDFSLSNSFWQHDKTMLLFAENRESALFFADVISIADGKTDFFVIGGGEMYRIFEDLFNKVYLTEVITGKKLERIADDAIFDYKFDNRRWNTIEERRVSPGPKDDFPSTFTILERRMKRVRYIDVKDYYTEGETKQKWVKAQLDLFDDFKIKNPSVPLRVPYQYELFEDGEQSV